MVNEGLRKLRKSGEKIIARCCIRYHLNFKRQSVFQEIHKMLRNLFIYVFTFYSTILNGYHCAPRNDITVLGTTIGPDYTRTGQQCKLKKHILFGPLYS